MDERAGFVMSAGWRPRPAAGPYAGRPRDKDPRWLSRFRRPNRPDQCRPRDHKRPTAWFPTPEEDEE